MQTLGFSLVSIRVLVEVGIDHSLEVVWEGNCKLRSVRGDCFDQVF